MAEDDLEAQMRNQATPPVDGPDRDRRWFAPALALVGLLGLLGRLVHLLASRVDHQPTSAQGDALWYWYTAEGLADGHLFADVFTGRPTAEHAPLTSVVLAPSAAIFDSTWAGRSTMALLGTTTIVVMGLATRRLAGPAAGLATALLVAASPALWSSDVLLMSETVTGTVLALLLWCVTALAERPTARLAGLAGTACGFAALARAELVLLLPLVVWPLLLVEAGGWSRRLRLASVAAAATTVTLLPWVGFNLARFEEPVTISTNDGVTLAGANCDATYSGPAAGGWSIDPCITAAYERIEAAKPERPAGAADPCPWDLQARAPCWDASQTSARLRAEAVAHVRANRAEVPRVVVLRNARIWGLHRPTDVAEGSTGEGREAWTVILGFGWTWALAPSSVAGALVLRRRGVPILPFGAMLAVVVLATSFSSGGSVRLRLPWDLASCVPAGVALAALVPAVRARTARLRTRGPGRGVRGRTAAGRATIPMARPGRRLLDARRMIGVAGAGRAGRDHQQRLADAAVGIGVLRDDRVDHGIGDPDVGRAVDHCRGDA